MSSSSWSICASSSCAAIDDLHCMEEVWSCCSRWLVMLVLSRCFCWVVLMEVMARCIGGGAYAGGASGTSNFSEELLLRWLLLLGVAWQEEACTARCSFSVAARDYSKISCTDCWIRGLVGCCNYCCCVDYYFYVSCRISAQLICICHIFSKINLPI